MDLTKLTVACLNFATAPKKYEHCIERCNKSQRNKTVENFQSVGGFLKLILHEERAGTQCLQLTRLDQHTKSVFHYKDPTATLGVFITHGLVPYNKEWKGMCQQSHIITNNYGIRHVKQGQLSRLQLTSSFKRFYELLKSFNCRTFRKADHRF